MNKVVFIKNGLVKYEDYKETLDQLEDKVRECKLKDKEIKKLKNGYCELKVKCNNGECDCTNEEYDGMIQSNIKLSLEVERLNNIINELERSLLEKVNAVKELKEMLGESVYSISPHIDLLEQEYNYFLDKIKELKEGK